MLFRNDIFVTMKRCYFGRKNVLVKCHFSELRTVLPDRKEKCYPSLIAVFDFEEIIMSTLVRGGTDERLE